MSITRLTGGLTPGDGGDPRTFPTVFNATADTIEAQGSAVASQGSAIDVLEALNPVQFGTAVPTDGQVLAFSTAVAGYNPVDLEDNGKILQVVSTTKTDTFSAAIAAGAGTAVTGLTASITPSSVSSKILVMVEVMGGSTLDGGATRMGVGLTLKRGATAIGIGDADGVRQRVTGATSEIGNIAGYFTGSVSFLDTPNTTSATTYSVDVSTSSGATQTIVINQASSDGNAASRLRGTSSITLMEVAG